MCFKNIPSSMPYFKLQATASCVAGLSLIPGTVMVEARGFSDGSVAVAVAVGPVESYHIGEGGGMLAMFVGLISKRDVYMS